MRRREDILAKTDDIRQDWRGSQPASEAGSDDNNAMLGDHEPDRQAAAARALVAQPEEEKVQVQEPDSQFALKATKGKSRAELQEMIRAMARLHVLADEEDHAAA